jgi:hypothetical protein
MARTERNHDSPVKRNDAAKARLTNLPVAGTPCGMSDTVPDQNFLNYKKAEKKALEIVAAMKATGADKVDIELALLVAVFELHKAAVPAATISSIVQGHLKQIVPHYASKAPAAK